MFTLDNDNRRHEFLMMNSISLKKILLVPLFEWKDPAEWGTRLASQNIVFKITGVNNLGAATQNSVTLFYWPYQSISFPPGSHAKPPDNYFGREHVGQIPRN